MSKCTYCNSELGLISKVYVCLCSVSKNGFGLMLANPAGEIVAWSNDSRMYCKACRPNYLFTNLNWSFKTNEESVKNT